MPSGRYPEPTGSSAATSRTPQVRPRWTRAIALHKSATWSDHVGSEKLQPKRTPQGT
jgi:hypothetical protein